MGNRMLEALQPKPIPQEVAPPPAPQEEGPPGVDFIPLTTQPKPKRGELSSSVVLQIQAIYKRPDANQNDTQKTQASPNLQLREGWGGRGR